MPLQTIQPSSSVVLMRPPKADVRAATEDHAHGRLQHRTPPNPPPNATPPKCANCGLIYRPGAGSVVGNPYCHKCISANDVTRDQPSQKILNSKAYALGLQAASHAMQTMFLSPQVSYTHSQAIATLLQQPNPTVLPIHNHYTNLITPRLIPGWGTKLCNATLEPPTYTTYKIPNPPTPCNSCDHCTPLHTLAPATPDGYEPFPLPSPSPLTTCSITRMHYLDLNLPPGTTITLPPFPHLPATVTIHFLQVTYATPHSENSLKLALPSINQHLSSSPSPGYHAVKITPSLYLPEPNGVSAIPQTVTLSPLSPPITLLSTPLAYNYLHLTFTTSTTVPLFVEFTVSETRGNPQTCYLLNTNTIRQRMVTDVLKDVGVHVTPPPVSRDGAAVGDNAYAVPYTPLAKQAQWGVGVNNYVGRHEGTGGLFDGSYWGRDEKVWGGGLEPLEREFRGERALPVWLKQKNPNKLRKDTNGLSPTRFVVLDFHEFWVKGNKWASGGPASRQRGSEILDVGLLAVWKYAFASQSMGQRTVDCETTARTLMALQQHSGKDVADNSKALEERVWGYVLRSIRLMVRRATTRERSLARFPPPPFVHSHILPSLLADQTCRCWRSTRCTETARTSTSIASRRRRASRAASFS